MNAVLGLPALRAMSYSLRFFATFGRSSLMLTPVNKLCHRCCTIAPFSSYHWENRKVKKFGVDNDHKSYWLCTLSGNFHKEISVTVGRHMSSKTDKLDYRIILNDILEQNTTENVKGTLPRPRELKAKGSTEELIPHNTLDLVVGTGEILKGVSADKAVSISKEKNLKLFLVNAKSKPHPTYKLVTSTKYFELQKKERVGKPKKPPSKELKISWNIADHDLSTKQKKITQWLKKYPTITLTVFVRGKPRQEMTKEVTTVLERLLKPFEDVLVVVNKPKITFGHVSMLKAKVQPESKQKLTDYKKKLGLVESTSADNSGDQNKMPSMEEPVDKGGPV